MQFSTRLLAFFLLLAVSLQADPTLPLVQRSRALLGSSAWSRIIRIENEAPGRYPRALHALVFELAGILWFYTPLDGTQSFSLHQDNLAAEKADFAPLLRDIEPGFRRWEIVAPSPNNGDSAPPLTLANGCFIESVAALRDEIAAGAAIEHPRLLSYFVKTRGRERGHTVLVYDTADGIRIVDPIRDLAFTVSRAFGADPLTLARAAHGRSVAAARAVGLESPRDAAPAIAALVRDDESAPEKHPPQGVRASG